MLSNVCLRSTLESIMYERFLIWLCSACKHGATIDTKFYEDSELGDVIESRITSGNGLYSMQVELCADGYATFAAGDINKLIEVGVLRESCINRRYDYLISTEASFNEHELIELCHVVVSGHLQIRIATFRKYLLASKAELKRDFRRSVRYVGTFYLNALLSRLGLVKIDLLYSTSW